MPGVNIIIIRVKFIKMKSHKRYIRVSQHSCRGHFNNIRKAISPLDFESDMLVKVLMD